MAGYGLGWEAAASEMKRRGLAETDGGLDLLRGGGLGEFDGCLLFLRKRWHVVERDGSIVTQGEGHSVGGDGEVLAGGFDGGAVEVQELIAVGGLVDVDGLLADLADGDVVEAEQGGSMMRRPMAKRPAACGKGEYGP